MTPVQIEAVKNSWSKVTPIADQASVLFYERLFTLDPSLRALFKPDMTEQRKLLMTMLGTAGRRTRSARYDRAGHPGAWPAA